MTEPAKAARLLLTLALLAPLGLASCGRQDAALRNDSPQAKSDAKSNQKANPREPAKEPIELPPDEAIPSTVPPPTAGKIRPLDRIDGEPDEFAKGSGANLVLDLATFMGASGKGNRFCIIADASISMNGPPILQVKAEILKSLSDLKPTSQFYVIFFNSTDVPMPYPNWLSATPENVDKVRPWVNGMKTVYKTLPQTSFDRAFKLDPKPDVIFFMTDGLLQGKPDPITQLKSLNASPPKTTIHTIMFSKGRANDRAAAQLREIAETNKGTFRHVTPK